MSAHRVPGYCIHTRKNLAYVRLNGEMIYLGLPDSPESKAKYDRLIAEWMQAGRTYVKPADKPGISVNEVLLAYRRYAEQTYVDGGGRPTQELERVNLAFRPVMDLYGTTPAEQFGPRALITVQNNLVDGDKDVDSYDLSFIRGAYGSTSTGAKYRWYFDFDGDGDVDSLDLKKVLGHLGKKVVY